MQNIYTIGHSTHPIDEFIELLKKHSITAICDVRSSPYSQWNPQFNRELLSESLKKHGIKYVFLGKELGARSSDPTCYREGKVQYDLLANTALFKKGLERIKEGSKKYRIALMCAEKDPLQCHRTILVARQLTKHSIPVDHILFDGILERHEQSIQRLLDTLNIASSDLFKSRDEIIREAYRKQGEVIAYSEQALDKSAEA